MGVHDLNFGLPICDARGSDRMFVGHDERVLLIADLVREEEASTGTLSAVCRHRVDAHRGEEQLLCNCLNLHAASRVAVRGDAVFHHRVRTPGPPSRFSLMLLVWHVVTQPRRST